MIWLPIRLVPNIIQLFDKNLGDYLNSPNYENLAQIQWFGFVSIAIVALICGD